MNQTGLLKASDLSLVSAITNEVVNILIGRYSVNVSTEIWSTCPLTVSVNTQPTNRFKYCTQDPQTGLEWYCVDMKNNQTGP